MRIVYEEPRGCGYRKDGGAYLVGDIGVMGSLPSCVEIDPPIPIDQDVIPFSRGVYIVNFDAVMTEDDQRLWLTGTSSESLRQRDDAAWEVERYGMRLDTRLKTGICKDMNPNQAEERLHQLGRVRGTYPTDYILDIARHGKGRRVAREVAVMQESFRNDDWMGLLASCWRLAGYDGKGAESVRDNLKRLMVSIGAVGDATMV